MTVDGREDLFHYTYLTTNGYLKKFRAALNLPNLDVPLLAALLKTYKNRTRRVGFITTNSQGKPCLYNKAVLNNILGITDDGHFVMKPEQNPELQFLHRILDEWDEKAVERDNYKEEPSKYNFNGEDDMEHQINTLGINENKKVKNIIITEAQYNKLTERLSESSNFVDPDKVKIVVKYLDDNFKKGGISAMGEDGYPTTIPIVALKGTDGQVIKNMTDKQLFAMLLDKFGKIYADKEQVKKFIKQLIKDWYYGKVSREGLLSVNEY